MLSGVEITKLASDPSETEEEAVDPTMFFDVTSVSDKCSSLGDKATEISRAQDLFSEYDDDEDDDDDDDGLMRTPELVQDKSPSAREEEMEPATFTHLREPAKIEVHIPQKVDPSNRNLGDCSVAHTALTRATAERSSPVFNEFCRVASWAEHYESLIRDYRLEAVGIANPETFEFIFAIPLRKRTGELNNQWHDCWLVTSHLEPRALRSLFVDPYNHDVVFAATLNRSDYSGKEFRLETADKSDMDGPYMMPITDRPCVSLRDGHLVENDSALECGIEVDVTSLEEKEDKILAYWHEVSNEWLHVPLRALDRVLIHQKRCVLNVFDIKRGRLTDDRLIMEPGIYSP